MGKTEQIKAKIEALEKKREDRINRYIIPLEIELEQLREALEKEQGSKTTP